LKREKDGVKIFHQRSPGLLHIKATGSIKVPLSGIAALFADVDNYMAWGYKIMESRLLKRVPETEVRIKKPPPAGFLRRGMVAGFTLSNILPT
jgi:hypothetical protein